MPTGVVVARMLGVIRMMTSDSVCSVFWRRNKAPINGRSPKYGTFVIVETSEYRIRPPMMMVSPSFTVSCVTASRIEMFGRPLGLVGVGAVNDVAVVTTGWTETLIVRSAFTFGTTFSVTPIG